MGVYLGNVEVGVSTGTTDYEMLDNLPQINGVVLIGNKSTEDLGIVSEESDPTVPQYVKDITETQINSWNDKLDMVKTTGVERAYVVNATGAQIVMPISNTYMSNSLAKRTGSGQLKARGPIDDDDLTTKKYVDSITASLAGQNEYVGSYQSYDYTPDTIQDALSDFVIVNTTPSREKRNGDIVNIVNGVYGGQQWIYNENEALWKYYIDFDNHSVINNLESDSEVDGLSAKQGKVLKTELDDVNTDLSNKITDLELYKGKTSSYLQLHSLADTEGTLNEDGTLKEIGTSVSSSMLRFNGSSTSTNSTNPYITKNNLNNVIKAHNNLVNRVSTLETTKPVFTATQLEDGSYSLSITTGA